MPKSRHRKNHKKKVAAYKKRKVEQRNAMMKKLTEQFQQQFAQEVQTEVDNLNQNNETENG
jgi:hypothetical protein